MAQQDKQHIGDNQNSQWWGAKQGLFINALANQYGQFTVDATWEATINQNTIFSYECWQSGRIAVGNGFSDGNVSSLAGISFLMGNRSREGIPAVKDNYFYCWESVGFKGQTLLNAIVTPNNNSILLYNTFVYDGVVNYSQNPPAIALSNSIYQQRIKEFNVIRAFSANPVLSTDNLYPINRKIMRVNYGNIENFLPISNYYSTGVMRDFRIYTRLMTDKEVSDNYHSMTATNTSNLFAEWKMNQASDFYVFGGNLYARNTGSSGNGLDNGTGYDMQMIGYNLNVPIFSSIYP